MCSLLIQQHKCIIFGFHLCFVVFIIEIQHIYCIYFRIQILLGLHVRISLGSIVNRTVCFLICFQFFVALEHSSFLYVDLVSVTLLNSLLPEVFFCGFGGFFFFFFNVDSHVILDQSLLFHPFQSVPSISVLALLNWLRLPI